MESLAPIVDRMRELAQNEPPAPRFCITRLRDDGTFDVVIYHYMGDDESHGWRVGKSTTIERTVTATISL